MRQEEETFPEDLEKMCAKIKNFNCNGAFIIGTDKNPECVA